MKEMLVQGITMEWHMVLWTLLLGLVLLRLYKWWQEKFIEKAFQAQGIKGPSGNLFNGGVMVQSLKLRHASREKEIVGHDILNHVLPDYALFSKQYGVPYFSWWLNDPRLVVNSPELARDILSKKAFETGKCSYQKSVLLSLLGNGLVTVDGDEWSHHRRVVSPAFHVEKLKNMIPMFESCTRKMIGKWERSIPTAKSQEFEVQQEFSKLAAEIISQTAFGSNYEKGGRVFEIQGSLGKLLSKVEIYNWIPFSRLYPTKTNRSIWKLQKEVDSLLFQLIQERKAAVKDGRGSNRSYGDDLLGLMLTESDESALKFDNLSLVGECKTFYLAGHETTATVLTWAVYLLALSPEWQVRAREEVLQVCNANVDLNAEILGRLKLVLVGMILNETLRLYPPAISMLRACFKDMRVGELYIPKGTTVDVPVLAFHHSKQLWGEDAHDFNPQRFANGASRASNHPNAFMPFSFGPRVCVGQSFAMLQLKAVMAMLLRCFSFSLSPNYHHCPTIHVTLKPQHGMQIIVNKLN